MVKIGKAKSHLDALMRRSDRISEYTSGDDADRIFERISRKIVADFIVRSSRRAASPQIRPIPWLEAVCYELVLEIIATNKPGVFKRRVEKYGRGKRGPKGNLFQVAILAIFAEHSLAELREQARGRLGKRLWCAFRHYVPACFLSGFLLQVCDRQFF